MSAKLPILFFTAAALTAMLILPASVSAREIQGCGCDDRDCVRSESCGPDRRDDDRRRYDDQRYDDRRYGYDRGYPDDRRYHDDRRYEDRRPVVTERPSFGSHAIRGWEPSNRVAPPPQDRRPLYRDSYRDSYRGGYR